MKYWYLFSFRTIGGNTEQRPVSNNLPGRSLAYIKLRRWLNKHCPGATGVTLVKDWTEGGAK